MQSDSGINDGLSFSLQHESGLADELRELSSAQGILGVMTLHLLDRHGNTKATRYVKNRVTDAGDLYYAGKAITGISPANPAAPTAASGMKLGTGTTAAAKNGAGAALVTYISGSNNPFDATYPQTNNLGAGLGVQARYVTTWAAGDTTNSAITEIVIVNDAGTDLTSSAANTYSRAVFSAINKTATDTLVATWNHLFLGA